MPGAQPDSRGIVLTHAKEELAFRRLLAAQHLPHSGLEHLGIVIPLPRTGPARRAGCLPSAARVEEDGRHAAGDERRRQSSDDPEGGASATGESARLISQREGGAGRTNGSSQEPPRRAQG